MHLKYRTGLSGLTALLSVSLICTPCEAQIDATQIGPVATSVAAFDPEMNPLPGVPVLIKTAQAPTFKQTMTGTYGSSSFFNFQNGRVIDYVLGDVSLSGGRAIGCTGNFQVEATGSGLRSFVWQTTQPWADTMLLQDNGSTETTYFPAERSFPFWDIRVPAQTGVSASLDVGMLLSEAVVSSSLDYYGYAGNLTWKRGLFINVNTPGGVDFGQDGLGLVMRNYGQFDYGNMELEVLHFDEDGVLEPFTFDIRKEALASSSGKTFYSFVGTLPEGPTCLLWRQGPQTAQVQVITQALNSPSFSGPSGGFETIELGEGEEECLNCPVPEPFATPGWSCDPGRVSAWTAFWNYDCPGDGDPVGDAVCTQFHILLSPVVWVRNGSFALTGTFKGSMTMSFPSKGVPLGGAVEFSGSESLDVQVRGRDCGECLRLWGMGLLCTQEYKNSEDLSCSSGGGYRSGTFWVKDCFVEDPIFTKCVDVGVTCTRCTRAEL